MPDLGKVTTIHYKNCIWVQVFHNILFFWPKNELVIFSWILQIWGGTFFPNTCHQYCVCPADSLLIFLIQNPLEVNYFKWRAIRKYYFILNCTGNVRLMADFCPWDSRGGVMENKVWDRTKPKMGIYTMSDKENLLDDHNVPGTENTHIIFFEDTNLVRILSYCFPTLYHDDLQWKSQKNGEKS